MSIPRILLGAAIAAALSIPLTAQQAPTGYHSIACAKINPGKWVAAQEWIAGTGHKLDQELVDSGTYASTIVLRTELPQGTASECDYVFVTFFNGLPPAQLSNEELSKALHKADIPMTAEEFYAKRGELGTLVYTNITQYQTLVGGAKQGGYLAFNSMSAPDVGACVAYNKKVWQPLAEEMVKAGNSDGWAINEQVFPRGTKDKTAVSTVDLFPSWDAFINFYGSIMDGWKKVHPDMDINSTMTQFGKLCSIEHTVLYKLVDVTVPAKK
jgi:hypothetical protein